MSARSSEARAISPTETVSDTFDAAIAVLQMFHFPAELIPFVLAVIGAAEGRTDWFPCRDRILGERALGESDTRTPEAKKKWVQRKRELLCEWQDSTRFILIECAPGGKSGDDFHPSRYRAHVLRFIEECTSLGQCYLEAGTFERHDAFKQAAWKIMPDAMKKLAAAHSKHERFNRARRSPEDEINRNLKASLNRLLRATELERASGGDPVAKVEEHLAAVIKLFPGARVHTEALREDMDTGDTRDTAGAPDPPPVSPSGASQGMDTSVPPPEPDPAAKAVWDNLSARMRGPRGVPNRDESVPPAEPKWDESVPPPDAPPDFANKKPEIAALEVFESAGAASFDVIHIHDPSPRKNKKREYEPDLDGAAFRENLGTYLEVNRTEQAGGEYWSMAVRPRSERVVFWQVDDATRATCERLRAVSLLQIETSPDNYQCWLAIGDEIEKDELDVQRERLLRVVKRTGGNGGSYGALRWPGSINHKPERKQADGAQPIVRIVHLEAGRVTTIAELEGLGLLAPPIKKAERSNFKVYANKVPTKWPSWDQELGYCRLKEDSGDPDRSEADFRWCRTAFLWGWSEAEITAELRKVSPKACDETRHYIHRTVERASAAAANGRAA
jgi:hypothetical protein